MKEVFQDYKHYQNWINSNWERTHANDTVIIQSGLMIERKINCNGEAYRSLTKTEFDEKHNDNFIYIPFNPTQR